MASSGSAPKLKESQYPEDRSTKTEMQPMLDGQFDKGNMYEVDNKVTHMQLRTNKQTQREF